MRKQIRTEIEIAAPAAVVWKHLTDFACYSKWNPFMREVIGSPAKEQRLKIRLEPPGGRAMTFNPIVLQAEPVKELRWIGRLLIPGLFDGEHYFGIEPISESRVRFVQRELFSGVMGPLVWRSTEARTTRGFHLFKEGLRRECERTA